MQHLYPENSWIAPRIAVTTSVTPNVVPSVSLTSPALGATYTLPAAISLTATATDSDGFVAKVEFFDGANKLGEVSAPSASASNFSYTHTFSTPGTHLFTARATDNKNATQDSTSVSVVLLQGLPYVSNFEASEGYTAGSLSGNHGWSVASGTARVTDSDAANGEQSVVLDANSAVTLLEQEFGAGEARQPVIYFDTFAKPVAGTAVDTGTLFDLDNARLTFVLNDTSGQFTVLDGDGLGSGTWKTMATLIPLASDGAARDWQRLTIRFDYTSKRWDLYLDQRLIALNLRLRHDTASYFSGLSFKGHTATASSLDNIYIGSDNPLFVDMDSDGITECPPTGGTPTSEEMALIGGMKSQVPIISSHIRVIYVTRLSASAGEAFFPAAFPNPLYLSYMSHAIIGSEFFNPILALAHEIGHILRNRGHVDSPIRLMTGTGTTPKPDHIDATKRLSTIDEKLILASPLGN